jgi:hypothetical protein
VRPVRRLPADLDGVETDEVVKKSLQPRLQPTVSNLGVRSRTEAD